MMVLFLVAVLIILTAAQIWVAVQCRRAVGRFGEEFVKIRSVDSHLARLSCRSDEFHMRLTTLQTGLESITSSQKTVENAVSRINSDIESMRPGLEELGRRRFSDSTRKPGQYSQLAGEFRKASADRPTVAVRARRGQGNLPVA